MLISSLFTIMPHASLDMSSNFQVQSLCRSTKLITWNLAGFQSLVKSHMQKALARLAERYTFSHP